MEQVKIKRVYRHFKGNYYFVEDVGFDSETLERMVIYRHLADDEDFGKLCIRPEAMFLESIPERPDNITGQTHRFELCDEIEKNYLKK